VGIPLHNFLAIGSCDKLLDLYLILHLCFHLDLLTVHCIEVPSYTVWGYNVVAQCWIVVAQCYTTAENCYMEVVPG
jgi:hypothetical protein